MQFNTPSPFPRIKIAFRHGIKCMHFMPSGSQQFRYFGGISISATIKLGGIA
jgi:hypothetical protein